jgi:hypothetical protein
MISSAKNKKMVVAALVFILLGILIKYRKCISNSWLYQHAKEEQAKQDIEGLQQSLEMQCLEWLCSLLLILQQNGLKIQ